MSDPPGSAYRNLLLRLATVAVLAPLTIAVAYFGGIVWIVVATLVAVGLLVEWVSLVGIRRVGWVVAGVAYAAAALIASVWLRYDAQYGFAATLFVLLIVWATDSGGYFAGRSIGGPKLWPRVSPNKTWAGAVGSVIAALAVAAGFIWAGYERALPLLGVAFILSVVSQCGDLFESAVKRRFGVKDSGTLIPGHGGLLDRLDGFVAAVIIAAAIGVLRGGGDGAGRGLMLW